MAAQKPAGIPSDIWHDLQQIAPFVEDNPTGIAAEGPTPFNRGAGAVESTATAVPDFLSRLTSANLWIRVGEVVVGLILLGIGLNAMLKGKPLQVVTQTAGVAGKAAML